MNKTTIILTITLSLLLFGCGQAIKQSAKTNNPTISYITPTYGDSNTLITIAGSNFGEQRTESRLYYGNQKLTPNSWNNNIITVRLYDNTLTNNPNGRFRVEVNNTYSNESPQTFTSEGISSSGDISPTEGVQNTLLTITLATATSKVYDYATFFELSNPANSSRANLYKNTDRQYYCYVPAMNSLNESTTIGLQLGNYTSGAATMFFKYISPSSSSISLREGTIGTIISLYGTGFGTNQSTYNSKIKFAENYVNPVSWTDREIKLRVPNFTTEGDKRIVLQTTSKEVELGYYKVIRPTISSYPAQKVSYNDSVTLFGSNFGDKADLNALYTGGQIILSSGHIINSSDNIIWSNSSIRFNWPVANTIIDKTVSLQIKVGNLLSDMIYISAE